MSDDYPAPIAFADIKIGMLLRTTGTWVGPDGHNNIVTSIGRVASIDNTAHIAYFTTGLGAIDPSSTGLMTTIEIMEEFTGDPTEPPPGTVIVGADGTVRQRVADPDDPAVSIWITPNSTTPRTWDDITTTGDVQVIGGDDE